MNYYVDIHANLLPGLPAVGGGTLSAEAAAERIAALRDSNIKIAVAAPFFDPEQHEPAEFLRLRDEKLEALRSAAAPMRLVSGAVLPFRYCVDHPRELKPFVLGESGYLMLDLPREKVSPELCEEIKRLQIVSGLFPIAVDIDRFFDLWTPEDWIVLRQTGILLQISVNGILQQAYRKLSLYLLANQYAHFVSTGARRIDEPLNFTEAMRLIQRSLPAQYYRRIKNNAGMLLSNAEPASFLSV
ncbi:MAG: hypothetical protein IJ060_06560 [Oscillospiraceae bacterium]|nr:hypothetical protein [Oscillospiraceae bacterium]